VLEAFLRLTQPPETVEVHVVFEAARFRSIESRTWLVICLGSIAWVSSSSRSAMVDLP